MDDDKEVNVDDESLLASPTKAAEASDSGKNLSEARYIGPRQLTDEEREEALRAELEGVQNINTVIEGVLGSLERAKENMEVVSRTVACATTLLNTWIRILSQTEHNQRLILDPSWQGASQDIADMENETIMRQQAAERQELEEQQRREAAARRAEEDERQRAEPSSGRTTRGGRGRGRAVGRGVPTTRSGYVGVGGQGTRGLGRGASLSGRGASGNGRTATGARGRGRGVQ